MDGAGGAVAVAPAGAVAVQVATLALELDEVAPAFATDPAVGIAAHVPAVDATASPVLHVLRAGGVVAGGAAVGESLASSHRA